MRPQTEEADPPGDRQGAGQSPQPLRLGALTDEDEAGGGQGRRDALEGEEHPIDALFAVEPPDVEHQRRTLAHAEAPSRGRAIARTEPLEVDAGRHHRDRRPDAARVQLVADHRRRRQHGIGPGGEGGGRFAARPPEPGRAAGARSARISRSACDT